MTGSEPLCIVGPALGCLEISSVARGIQILDRMVKRATTDVVLARTLSPGRYLIVISGGEAEVDEAMDAALAMAEEDLVDHVNLPAPAGALKEGLAQTLATRGSESLLIVETKTISALLAGVDRCLKNADVAILDIRLGAGLSGKGVFLLTGSLHMVEAAATAAREAIGDARLVALELIAQPHPDLPSYLVDAEPTIARGRKRS